MAPREVEIDPKVGNGRAGIDLKGREVSKVMTGGQSEAAGVKIGWKVILTLSLSCMFSMG